MDPRDEVTEVAFRVDPKLLGMELATPWRRGMALFLDLLFAGCVSALGVSGVVAWLFGSSIYARLARRAQSQSRIGRVRNALAGVAAFGAFLLVADTLTSGDADEDDGGRSTHEPLDGRRAQEMTSGPDPLEAFAGSTSSTRTLTQTGSGAGLEMQGMEWTDLEPVFDHVAARIASEIERTQTSTALHKELEECEDARENLEAFSLVRSARSLAGDFGLTLTWVGFYFVLFTRWWEGSTPGKRMLGIRVRRLDGRRVTWWQSFERFGGLAAGIGTGLLGFVQIFWDANRQAIHDKIAATVVTRERPQRKIPQNRSPGE